MLQERSLVVSTAMADSQEMIDNQISCCKTDNGADDFDSCYHTLQEVRIYKRTEHEIGLRPFLGY